MATFSLQDFRNSLFKPSLILTDNKRIAEDILITIYWINKATSNG